MRHLIAGLIAALLAAAGPATGQPSALGPTSTSDAVRAARNTAGEEALAFDVRMETTTPNAPTTVQLSHVVLAPDFIYVVGGKTHELDDFALHRTFSWSDGAASFSSVNGHATPAFRVMELANRRVLHAMLSHAATVAGKPLPVTDDAPYWREAELGVADPSDGPLILRKTASGTDYLLGDDPVVRTQGQATPLRDDDRRPFTRYLALHANLHPQARHLLVDAGVLPDRLEVELFRLATRQTITSVFSHPVRAEVAYPLPPALGSDVEAVLGSSGTASSAGVRAAAQAIAGRYPRPKPTFDDITTGIRRSAAANRPMETWLLWLELTQQYAYRINGVDGPTVQALAPLLQAAARDPDVARFNEANTLAGVRPGSPDERQAAARYLASAKALDALPFGTFRYVTFANLVHDTKDTAGWDKAIFSAMPSPLVANDWTHIAAYPWAAGAYNDAGAAYLAGFDTPKAWTAFDLGRAVDPDWRSGSLQSVANYEAVLEANQPDFF